MVLGIWKKIAECIILLLTFFNSEEISLTNTKRMTALRGTFLHFFEEENDG